MSKREIKHNIRCTYNTFHSLLQATLEDNTNWKNKWITANWGKKYHLRLKTSCKQDARLSTAKISILINSQRHRDVGRPRSRWQDRFQNFWTTDLAYSIQSSSWRRKKGLNKFGVATWARFARDHRRATVNTAINSWFQKEVGNFLGNRGTISF